MKNKNLGNCIMIGSLGTAALLGVCLAAWLVIMPRFEDSRLRPLVILGFILTFGFLFAVIIYFLVDYYRIKEYKHITLRSLNDDRKKYQRKYKELRDFYQDADPYVLDIEKYPQKAWYQSKGVIFGKVKDRLICRKASDPGSILVAGLPGDGKTTAIVIPTAAVFGGSCFVVDIKGDILNAVKKINPRRKRVIFNPSSVKSWHFDPFYGLKDMDETDVEVMINNMASILVPDEESRESKFFVDGARSFFCGIFFFFWENGDLEGFMFLVNVILNNNFTAWLTAVHKDGKVKSRKYLEAFVGANEKNTGGQYGKLVESLRPLTLGALPEILNNQGKMISPDLLQKGYDVYIEIPQHLIKQYSSITTLISSTFMNYWMRLTDNSIKKPRPTLMILDEFAQMHFQGDLITSALATLRSKGVTLMMIVQSLAQLQKNYGDKDARTIVETCAYKCVLSAGDPDSMQYFSKLFGKRKCLRVSTSRGDKDTASRSVNETEEEIVKPTDFAALNSMGDGGKVVIQANGRYVLADKCFWFLDKKAV